MASGKVTLCPGTGMLIQAKNAIKVFVFVFKLSAKCNLYSWIFYFLTPLASNVLLMQILDILYDDLLKVERL